MRDLLIISGVLALFALAFLIKAARHTWHIELLRNQSPLPPAGGRNRNSALPPAGGRNRNSPLPPAGGAGGGPVRNSRNP